MTSGHGCYRSFSGYFGRIRTEYHAVYDNSCRSRSSGFCKRALFALRQSGHDGGSGGLRYFHYFFRYSVFRFRFFDVPGGKYRIRRFENSCGAAGKTNGGGSRAAIKKGTCLTGVKSDVPGEVGRDTGRIPGLTKNDFNF